MSTYAIVIEKGETGTFGAYSPDLPGCVAVGETEEETLQLMREAMTEHLALLRAEGDVIPESHTVSATTFTIAA
ncbi:type II toxin-antitoxin system HicB family antitoxin [Kutzneria kofuensis]|uniref:Putative RNase H-like HicB family nuclease n=1 Tax=Kutzneria kofuensis TaxID=103725 RepID=A0A7W9NG02_9PSEU|nr:type II toxin-antitoxin system HicB family antitoxin [Kutzneria kofuensis]MBB5891024.1 putative RNase H-like HicB family nuclease [Kutzneria kofuensis]